MATFRSSCVPSVLRRSPLLSCVALIFAFPDFSIAARTQVSAQAQNRTVLETQAIHQMAQGNAGDFSSQAAVVSNGFVAKLLSGAFRADDPSNNMEIHGIHISNAVFQEEVDINFEVPYRVVFDHCQFQKGLDFSGAQFDKDLVFDSSRFGTDKSNPQANDDEGVRFINSTINGTLSIENPTFDIPVDLTKAHVKELDIENAVFWTRALAAKDPSSFSDQDIENLQPDLDLSAVSADTDLSLSVRATRPLKVDAQLLSVGRSASLGAQGMGFFATREFFLPNTRFQKLTIYELEQWLQAQSPGAVTLDGLSFQEVVLSSNHKLRHESQMLDLLESPQVSFSPQPFLVLEQYLTSTGDQTSADNVYIRMRELQRTKKQHALARAADWVLDWLIGYGREPGRAVWWTLGFVVLGMLVFSPRHMIAQADEDGKNKDSNDNPDSAKKSTRAYSRFWYSLDVLAPAIELGADDAWKPDPNWRFGRNYSYVHRIVGWILVPLILAALTGIIH